VKRLWVFVALLGVVALPLAACGGGKKSEASNLQLGSTTIADHGTKDVTSSTSVDLEADSYYFEPTFLRGKPGEKLTLKVENDSNTLHNLSVKSLGIDSDIQPKSDTEVEVTFPQSGVLLFFCKYHAGQGMNGKLLTGDSAPQEPPAS
jgi:plastocyanin